MPTDGDGIVWCDRPLKLTTTSFLEQTIWDWVFDGLRDCTCSKLWVCVSANAHEEAVINPTKILSESSSCYELLNSIDIES